MDDETRSLHCEIIKLNRQLGQARGLLMCWLCNDADNRDQATRKFLDQADG